MRTQVDDRCATYRGGRMTRRTARGRGFTLIELLVVVAIIVTLIALLMPALAGARDAAKGVACGSNLRQVGVAMSSYVTDQNGRLPYAYINLTNAGGNVVSSWDHLLFPYLNLDVSTAAVFTPGARQRMPVYRCPADSLQPDSWVAGQNLFRLSYAICIGTLGSGNSGYNGIAMGCYDNTATSPATLSTPVWFNSIRMTQIVAPATTLFVSERMHKSNLVTMGGARCALGYADQQINILNDSVGILPVHPGGKLNYLMADGHIETMRPRDTVPAASITKAVRIWSRDPDD